MALPSREMTGSGSSSLSSFRQMSSRSSLHGASTISRAEGRRRASTSRSHSSEASRTKRSTRSEASFARRLHSRQVFCSSPSATRRLARSACSSSPTRVGRLRGWLSAFTCAWKRQACIGERPGRGFRTLPSCAFAGDRSCPRRSPRSGNSLRPASLLCFHVCTRRGRGTRYWSRVR